ncbi:hypothetical protein M0813_12876 [Anaeramoeba flamelloides]|uniref:Amine oxidase domain-containing protein n=1 Tax=Anaeramoeba flamelloides TaxID=1746091 RepID=A0ABQ8ZB21_9EUKA|nr:hypothetical protein M0813_12876 [Anaeramoeba flamelloides]
MHKKIFDTIVIGSGAGGLSSAAYLSRKGLNVLLCEKMNEIGGYLINFQRTGKSGDKYRFDTGLHYVSECGQGCKFMTVLEELVGKRSHDLKWNMMDPHQINRYIYNDFEYSFPMGLHNFEKSILYKFPDAKEEIKKAFRLVRKIDETLTDSQELVESFKTGSLLTKIQSALKLIPILPKTYKYLTSTALELLSEIKDPRVLKIMDSFSGECGSSIETSSSIVFLMINSYSNGSYYPQGGTSPMINLFRDTVLENGGQIKKKTGVTSIRKEGKLFKVQTNRGEFFSKTVVSNTDPQVLYSDLLPQEMVSKKMKKKISKTTSSASTFITFIGTDLDLSKYMTSGNISLFDDSFSNKKSKGIVFGGHFVASPTLKDPNGGHSAKGKYSLEILSDAGPFEDWKQWENSKPYQRPIEYMKKKEEIGMQVIKLVERKLLPNLTSHLDFVEFASPLTNVHYVSAKDGAICGPAQIPSQCYLKTFPIKTCVPGLYHCGSSTFAAGVQTSIQSGLLASKELLKHFKK